MKNLSCLGSSLAITLTLCLAEEPLKAQNTSDHLFFPTANDGDSTASDSLFTIYGVFSIKGDNTADLIAANNLGAEYIRETQLLSKWNGINNPNIDFWKSFRKKILLNINNDSLPSPFPTNLAEYENKLRSFLSVYADSIELAVIENEELNKYVDGSTTLSHLGSLGDYVSELAVAVNVCQEMGVPVANGGLTGGVVSSLLHYYVANNKQDSVVWLVRRLNGVLTDSSIWMRTDTLLYAFRTLPLSYVNLHWYEPVSDTSRTSGVLPVVCNYITQQTGKKVITNETGVTTTDSSFVRMLMQQWGSGYTDYCIFFDGAGGNGAQPLTSTTGDLVENGIAFRDFINGTSACQKPIKIRPEGLIEACYGDTVQLTASDGLNNYVWSTGDTSQSIAVTVVSGNNYSVRSEFDNCTAFSNSLAITTNPLPAKPVITADPFVTTEVCPGKFVKLSSSPALTYLWNTGSTTKNISATRTGSYYVTISDINGCKNKSDSVVVTYQKCVVPANLTVSNVATARATLAWDTATCGTGYYLQYREKDSVRWTSAGVFGNGSSYKNLYYLKPSTTYQWKILTVCRRTPDTVASVFSWGPEFTTLANSALEISAVVAARNSLEESIFPVPARNIATLTVNHVTSDLKVMLTDLNGRVLWQGEITGRNTNIPVSGLASGGYLVTIQHKDHNKTLKLVKE